MNKLSAIVVSHLVGISLTALTATAQQAPVNLGSDSSFALLAGTTVTVTGAGSITGDIGIFPGTAYVPGSPPVAVNGTVYPGGSVAAQAQADLTTAYNDAAGRSVDAITVAGNIGGMTLAPGLYKSTSSLAISSGNLTLDAQGDASAVWIFQIASTLTTTSGLQVILAGGANPANIFWQVGTSATIGTTSVFQGNILAAISISMLTGSTLTGRALAEGGAVTVDTGGGTSASLPAVSVAPGTPVTTMSVISASYLAPVVAGSIAAVFGSNLSIGQAPSTSVPLPTTLAESNFRLGGKAAPLFFAMPTQVNLQVPWELAGQVQTVMTVTVDGITSTAQTIALAPFNPGIFSVNAMGTGQGAILVAPTSQLAAAGSPVSRGGYISIYCTGLGAVTNQPATGVAAPDAPLSSTLITPTVSIGGVSAGVTFSGLAPGFVGLYQVNAGVPAGVSPGDAVPVVVTMENTVSNTVTIAVQ